MPGIGEIAIILGGMALLFGGGFGRVLVMLRARAEAAAMAKIREVADAAADEVKATVVAEMNKAVDDAPDERG